MPETDCKRHPLKPSNYCSTCPKLRNGRKWCRCGVPIMKGLGECRACRVAGLGHQSYTGEDTRETLAEVRSYHEVGLTRATNGPDWVSFTDTFK